MPLWRVLPRMKSIRLGLLLAFNSNVPSLPSRVSLSPEKANLAPSSRPGGGGSPLDSAETTTHSPWRAAWSFFDCSPCPLPEQAATRTREDVATTHRRIRITSVTPVTGAEHKAPQ